MRIVIASGIFPPDLGGPATYVPVVAAGWAALGDTVTVVTMSDAAPPEDRYAFSVVRIARSTRALIRWTRGTSAIAAAARGADVVYAVGLLPQAAAAAALTRRPLVARVVSDLAWDRATAYGWTADDLATFQRRRYGLRIQSVRTLQHWVIRRADRIIVPSEWLATWVRPLSGASERVRVIPNALAPLPAIHPVRPAAPTPYVVATSGRLVRVKQIDLALRMLPDVPEASLLILGDGPERRALAELAATLGLTPRVIFAGARPRDEMLALLAGCDALLQCSAHEGFPFAVLEAMAVGVPVISTAVGGVREMITDGVNGILVDGTEAAVAQSLRRVLNDPPLRARLASRARADIARYSADAMVRATRDVLAEVAK